MKTGFVKEVAVVRLLSSSSVHFSSFISSFFLSQVLLGIVLSSLSCDRLTCVFQPCQLHSILNDETNTKANREGGSWVGTSSLCHSGSWAARPSGRTQQAFLTKENVRVVFSCTQFVSRKCKKVKNCTNKYASSALMKHSRLLLIAIVLADATLGITKRSIQQCI